MQLKVRLLGISPMIWRRVLVPASISLHELHGVLQVAMGWESIHLFAFDIYGVQYGSFELSIGSPRAPLTQFGFRKNDKLSYTYDMGDGWVHEIRVEGCSTTDPKSPARCALAARVPVRLRSAADHTGTWSAGTKLTDMTRGGTWGS